MSSVSGVLGIILASFGMRRTEAQESLTIVGESGVEVYRPRYEAPDYPIIYDVRWTGHDGTAFRMFGYHSPVSAHRVYTVYATRLDDYAMPMRSRYVTEEFVANVGEDNFEDMLAWYRQMFEFEYYNGSLDNIGNPW